MVRLAGIEPTTLWFVANYAEGLKPFIHAGFKGLSCTTKLFSSLCKLLIYIDLLSSGGTNFMVRKWCSVSDQSTCCNWLWWVGKSVQGQQICSLSQP